MHQAPVLRFVIVILQGGIADIAIVVHVLRISHHLPTPKGMTATVKEAMIRECLTDCKEKDMKQGLEIE